MIELASLGEGLPLVTTGKVTGGARAGAGAPLGNLNRAKHGMRGGGWRKAWSADKRRVGKLQTVLEGLAATVPLEGAFAIRVAALIQTCLRHERTALLANRFSRTDEGLSSMEITDLATRAATASEKRDTALAKLFDLLGIDEPAGHDPWADVGTASTPAGSPP